MKFQTVALSSQQIMNTVNVYMASTQSIVHSNNINPHVDVY